MIMYVIILISLLSFLSLAPWVPTRWNDLKRIHQIMWLLPGQKMLEIWCGNARVSLYLARHNPKVHIIGIELSPLLYLISKLRVGISWLKNIDIIYWNALSHDMSHYDALYIFGLPHSVTHKIFPKLQLQMKWDAVFYSYCFDMKNDYFSRLQHKPNSHTYSIYEYKHKKNSIS